MNTPSVTVCNPLLRTPLSILVDDSCPVVNLTHYWIQQRHAWKQRHTPDAAWRSLDGHIEKLGSVPPTIPASFAAKWGEWCGEQGIRGKFSLVPYPAGVGRIDQGFDQAPRAEYEAWMQVARDIIWPNFDITCEMLTHTQVVDLKTWQFTEEWEQYEWVDPPVEPLTDYIAAAMTLLRNAGFPVEGVTSPGAFGRDKEAAYALATLEASLRVNGNPRPFYFLHVNVPPKEWPDVAIWHADKARGSAIASIIGCTGDWFGNWTGYDAGDPDLFITEDLQGGALPQVLSRELPCVLVSHWPGFYFGGQEVGFDVLKEVKRRLDAYDPDGTRTLWMKHSEIGHYWMARQLSDIVVQPAGNGELRAQIDTQFPTADFTVALSGRMRRVRVDGHDLQPVHDRRSLRQGTYLVEGGQTFAALDLALGTTALHGDLG